MKNISAEEQVTEQSLSDPQSGSPFPLGATPGLKGTNFSIFSIGATLVELLLFDQADAARASRVVSLDAEQNRTSHYWHVFVPGIKSGQLYGYRVHGPNDPANGQRFDAQKLLLDPYARGVYAGDSYSRSRASEPGDNCAQAMRSVVVDVALFDWEGDKPLNRSFRQTVIYEMHVRGFTRNPNSGVAEANRGTFLGLIEKIPYLRDLGITAVELLPVFQFDSQDAVAGLVNYWGYSPVSFFAPHLAYATRNDAVVCVDEFRTMVKALHRAGIEVILDVVYNHTAEGNEHGPTLSLRGLENSTYYLLNKDRATYTNDTGTGNTLRANNTVVKRLILESLIYWVSEMHVDGFRFDLASVFSRNQSGAPMADSPIIWDIDSHPVLAGTKLIAEAWDEGGLYQVGSFGQDKWKEWNGQFRDDVRGFVKGDQATVTKLRERMMGSLDLYAVGNRPAGQSINLVTCHDGFTLADLVSFNKKHNETNLGLNSDGANSDLSWNCGVEGATQDATIQRLRSQQIKNFLALTLLSVGTPMLLMGDEIRRSQQGNNNAYCQDNETSWFDWSLCSQNSDLFRFVQRTIDHRLNIHMNRQGVQVTLEEYLTQAHVHWHGTTLNQPDWSIDSHSLAFTMQDDSVSHARYIAVNSYWEALDFELPPTGGKPGSGWYRFMDTSLASPNDIADPGLEVLVTESKYRVGARSIIMLHYKDTVTDVQHQLDNSKGR